MNEDLNRSPEVPKEEETEDRGAFEGLTSAQISQLLLTVDSSQRWKMARFLKAASKPREVPSPKPKKPAPRSREKLLAKKAQAQGWGETP